MPRNTSEKPGELPDGWRWAQPKRGENFRVEYVPRGSIALAEYGALYRKTCVMQAWYFKRYGRFSMLTTA